MKKTAEINEHKWKSCAFICGGIIFCIKNCEIVIKYIGNFFLNDPEGRGEF